MEQLCQPGGDILFQCGDACHDILHGFRCLILVEIAGHGDLVAHLGLAVVDPCGKISVYGIDGRMLFYIESESDTEKIPMERGVYLVKVDNRTIRVQVR